MKQQDGSSFQSAEEVWAAEFQEMCGRISPVFARSETRQRAQTYLKACSALSNAKMDGNWPNKQARARPMPCNTCSTGRCGMRRTCVMRCASISEAGSARVVECW